MTRPQTGQHRRPSREREEGGHSQDGDVESCGVERRQGVNEET